MVQEMDLDGDGKINIPELDIHMLKIMNSLSKDPSDDGGDEETEDSSEQETAKDLRSKKKAELVDIAKERNLSHSGTKEDIIDRLLNN